MADSGGTVVERIGEESTVTTELRDWVLIDGNRLVIAGSLVVACFLLLNGLANAEVITLGSSSSVRTMLASGIASGVLTLITVILSINQLLLSRVFGSINELEDRFEGTMEFRERVEDVAGIDASSNDPAEFLLLITRTLRDRGERLGEEFQSHGDDIPDELGEYPDDMIAYADSVADRIENNNREGKSKTNEILAAILGPEYAYSLTATRRLQGENALLLSATARNAFDDILELLKSLAILRQFFKTMAIQQDLAQLSRLIAYTGVVAVLTTYSLTLVYQSSSGALLPTRVLTPLVSAGLAVTLAPLALLIAYILRVATISRYTASVGPFVPPEEEYKR